MSMTVNERIKVKGRVLSETELNVTEEMYQGWSAEYLTFVVIPNLIATIRDRDKTIEALKELLEHQRKAIQRKDVEIERLREELERIRNEAEAQKHGIDDRPHP